MPLERLPLEIASEILGHLSPRDKSRLSRTHKALYGLCTAELYRYEIRTQSFACIKTSCVLWAAYYGRIETLKQAVKYGANITGPSRELAAKRRRNSIYTTLYVAIMADEYAMIQHAHAIFNTNGQLNPRSVVVDRPATGSDEDHGSDGEPTHTLESANQVGGRYSVQEDSFISLQSRKYLGNTGTGVEFPLLEALRQAAFYQNEQAAQMLLCRGAYLIKPGVSALDFYTNFGSSSSDLAGSERIRKLLAKTPKTDALGVCVPGDGGVPQTDEDKSKLLRLLCGVDLEGTYIPPLSYAAWIARPDLVEIALAEFNDGTERSYRWSNTTALGLAVQSRDLTTVKLILSRCSDLKVPFNLLLLTAKDENDEPFRSLYQQDVADISGRSDFGMIIEALSRPGKERLLKEVLDAANLTKHQLSEMEDHHRWALFSAVKRYHLDSLELLLSYEAIANAAMSLSPKTLIHHACTGEPVWEVTPIIGCLVRHGFHLHANAGLDETLPPVPYALLHGNVFAVLSLLKWGANPDTGPSAALSSMHYLVMNDRSKVSINDTTHLISELIQRKASINRLCHTFDTPNYTGSLNHAWASRFKLYQATPLFFAALNGAHMALILKLLDSGASATSTIIYKKSPMCLIAGLIAPETLTNEAADAVFAALMKHGARLDDKCGRDWGSALDRACFMSRGLKSCCFKLNPTSCDMYCGNGDSEPLKSLLRFAYKKAVCLEHVQHHLHNCYIKVKTPKRPRQWSCKPLLLSRDSTDPTNEILEGFIKKHYSNLRTKLQRRQLSRRTP